MKRARDNTPKFQCVQALNKLDTTLIRGLQHPDDFDPVLCPAQRLILAFGQSGTGHAKALMQRLEESQINFKHIVVKEHNIEKLPAMLRETAVEFATLSNPCVLVLENFQDVVLGAPMYKDTAMCCAKLKEMLQDMRNPNYNVHHGILCISNVPPTRAPTALASKLWSQFDMAIGYTTITRDQRRTLFEWYFAAFKLHCQSRPNLQNIVFDVTADDLEHLLDCSVQATPKHIEVFCQNLFRGAMTLAMKGPCTLDRTFITTGTSGNQTLQGVHGFLHRVGTMGTQDDDDDAHCIIPADLVALEDAIRIPAGYGPYVGAQPVVTMGQERHAKRMKLEMEQEEQAKEKEEEEP